jgi:diguanylate cyclase (GGDEF)-like protein
VDVDHLSNVNDTHGHLLGDKVLRAVARTMKANI